MFKRSLLAAKLVSLIVCLVICLSVTPAVARGDIIFTWVNCCCDGSCNSCAWTWEGDCRWNQCWTEWDCSIAPGSPYDYCCYYACLCITIEMDRTPGK